MGESSVTLRDLPFLPFAPSHHRHSLHPSSALVQPRGVLTWKFCNFSHIITRYGPYC